MEPARTAQEAAERFRLHRESPLEHGTKIKSPYFFEDSHYWPGLYNHKLQNADALTIVEALGPELETTPLTKETLATLGWRMLYPRSVPSGTPGWKEIWHAYVYPHILLDGWTIWDDQGHARIQVLHQWWTTTGQLRTVSRLAHTLILEPAKVIKNA